MKCVPANKNQTHPYTSYDFIEQECTELWPVYAKYFPYFLSLQCFLLLALRTNWKRICRDQLGAFLGVAEECKAINVTQCKVKKFLDFQRRSVEIFDLISQYRSIMYEQPRHNHGHTGPSWPLPCSGNKKEKKERKMWEWGKGEKEIFTCFYTLIVIPSQHKFMLASLFFFRAARLCRALEDK